ncbi:hypothetical protein KHQ81_06745 [Mycoplasmatota bacterium]|nr:hypothetical protein KHQ81_06745 [Mycoplasmatota bacterium]
MKDNRSKSNNKLNTRSNADRRANKTNTHEYNYELGQDDYDYEFGQENESRYDYEFGQEANAAAKDSPLARGANVAGAFSSPDTGATETSANRAYDEEYSLGQPDNASLQREVNARGLKKKYQENLRQNYNVEFSDDELIDDNCEDCGNCENCSECQK